MLEIIALIILTKGIGRLAEKKGLKPGRWQLYTVLAWIAGEFLGAVLGGFIFGIDNIFSIVMLAFAGAISGYFIVKANLSKRPHAFDEIDQIGSNNEG
jgi:hypothetical protein